MILTDTEIREEIDAKSLVIDPFDENNLEPASYDLMPGKDAATISKNGELTIDFEKVGVLVLEPYAPAVLSAREHLVFPLDMAGRFGLKSGLSRRGVYASVGPQVDPGFDGWLSVTLFNFTPTPLALNFTDTFLSLEIHRLGQRASRGYEGDYQKTRPGFSAKELGPVLGYKGHGLSDAVAGVNEIRQSLGKMTSLSDKFESFLASYEKQNRDLFKFNQDLLIEMKKLVEHISNDRPRTVMLRAITRDEAKAEILNLFKKTKETLFYSDVAERLNLDLELVVDVCNELESKGSVGVLKPHEAKRPKAKRH